MHPAFSAKHFLQSKDSDAVTRLQAYTQHCEDKHIRFAEEIGRVSVAVAELRDSIKSARSQRRDGHDNSGGDQALEQYCSNSVHAFTARTRHYVSDAAAALQYFGDSVPHHIKKIERLASSHDKSYVHSPGTLYFTTLPSPLQTFRHFRKCPNRLLRTEAFIAGNRSVRNPEMIRACHVIRYRANCALLRAFFR